jgi:hypothetical protein
MVFCIWRDFLNSRKVRHAFSNMGLANAPSNPRRVIKLCKEAVVDANGVDGSQLIDSGDNCSVGKHIGILSSHYS